MSERSTNRTMHAVMRYPQGSREEFRAVVQESIARFIDNPLRRRIDDGQVTLSDYHAYLKMIFPQTFVGPSTFALAGAHCDNRHHDIRDYLIEHADEEKAHWQWVIEDLRSTGYDGPDPRTLFPHLACQAFVSFNTYLAVKQPIARLGTAAVLEGIGARYGKAYAEKLCDALGLTPAQARFLFGHGDTDVGHTADIIRVLGEAELTGYDWAWLCYAARTGSQLYKAMYEAV